MKINRLVYLGIAFAIAAIVGFFVSPDTEEQQSALLAQHPTSDKKGVTNNPSTINVHGNVGVSFAE